MGLLVFYALISIFFSFLCSILEAAFLSVTPTFLRMKKNEGKAYAETLEMMKKNVDQPLIAILTVNTIAHTVGAILVGVQAEKVFSNGGNMVGIVSAIMTLAILIISEIIPKTIGANYWQSLGNFTATSLQALIFPLKYTGILWLMMQITKLMGKSPHTGTVSKEEYIALTDAAVEEGVFGDNETTFIQNILKFKSIKAQNIMTPFAVALIAEENMTIKEFYDSQEELIFSRIPIYETTPNNITGFVLKDKVLEELIENKSQEPLKSIKKEIPIVSKETPITKLFKKFIEDKAHMAVLVDEYGHTVGLVTMEDIIETLLGLEIMDESDNIEDMQILARQNWERRARRMGILGPKTNKEE